MRLLLPLLVLLSSALSAQSIERDRSRFLSAPNGRTGTYAPYRLSLKGLGGVETLTVRSHAPGVTLTREVAVGGVDHVEVVLPVFVGEGSRVEIAGGEAIEPKLPMRRIEPDYERPYVAVFSNDPMYARVLVPNGPRAAVCDYYELAGFFNDWRMFDGYDAIVIVNPDQSRLPPGSQRAIAEFCSLGGDALVIGSLSLGEKDVDVPAPAESRVLIFRGVQVQRFGYGPGAIYRMNFDDLQRSRFAGDVVADALHDQYWFGAGRAPGGRPASRASPRRAPFAPPLPPVDVAPTPLFWGLGGGILLLCLLAPLVGARVTRRAWPAHLVVLAGCAGLGGLATLQDRPLPTVEQSALVRSGEGKAASMRVFLLGDDAWRDTLLVDLDKDRSLPRRVSGRAGRRGWAVDLPLVDVPPARARPVELQGAMIGDQVFRDYASDAHRGDTEFSTSDAYLLEWWLEANAYRGRAAALRPLEWPVAAPSFDDARVVTRGAIGVTLQRKRD